MAYKILKPGQMHPVKGVLFDMDGLVLDTEKLYTRFWMEAAGQMGFPMSWQQSLGMRSLNRNAGQEYLEKCFGKEVDYPAMRSLRIQLMDAFIAEHGVTAKPGIHRLLDDLEQRKIQSAITTSSPLQRIREYLTPLDLYHRFTKVCSGYQVKQGKPAPDIYLFGAQQIGKDPACCLALEDSPAGILSACRAGCLPVIVPDLDEPDEATLENCFAVADSLADVCDLLEELNGEK